MILVAFGHQKRVGKDQFAKFCVDYLRQTDQYSRKKIVRRGFADKLYEFCYSMYSYAGFKTRQYYIENQEAKEEFLPAIGMTARQLLIDISNKIREFDPNIWLNGAVKDTTCDLLFITDCRYPNEFNTIESSGGILVRVTRPDLPVPTDMADTALIGWEDKWHHTINNDGDLNNLRLAAETFCRHQIINRKPHG